MTCTHPGCTKPAKSSMCRYHLQVARNATYEPCTYPDCPNLSLTVTPGLCRQHRRQQAAGKPLRPIGTRVELTACKHGHPYTPENTAYTPTGSRYCRTCKREWQRIRRGTLAAANPRPPRPPKAAKPAPTPKPAKPPKSKLPKGWLDPLPQRRPRANTGGKLQEVPAVPPTPPDVLTAAHACLERHDALDLADMLGLGEVA